MTPTPIKLSTGQVGAAGEHYVAMRLSMTGLDAAIPPAGNPITDVIATSEGNSRTIQVKTRRHALAHRIDMTPGLIVKPDYVVIVLLGEAASAEPAPPVAYVLPRAAMIEAWEAFGYTHPKRCNMRLDYTWLEPFREAWHVIAEDLAD